MDVFHMLEVALNWYYFIFVAGTECQISPHCIFAEPRLNNDV